MSEDAFKVALGEWMVRERTELAMTQAEVAEAMRVSVSTISNWEAAKVSMNAYSQRVLSSFFRQARRAKGLAEVAP